MKKMLPLPRHKNKKPMGRKKLDRPSIDSLFITVSQMLVPEHVLEHFDIWDAHEHKDRWVNEYVESECKKLGIAIIKQVGDTIEIYDGHLKVF